MRVTIPEYIRDLAAKYLSGTITPEEKEQFNAWYQHQSEEELEWDEPSITSEAELQQLIFKNIEAQQQLRKPAPVRIRVLRITAAAAAILAIVAGFTWWQQQSGKPAPAIPIVASGDKAPGKTGAILLLGDGSQVSLEQAAAGQLAVQGTTRIMNENGKLVYTNEEKNNAAVVNNTVMTPAGRQYQLTLPDGTAVWLNAASSISFPTAFTGNSREVLVKGEAYFEVAAGRTPFKVNLEDATIMVLGTHFNVKAYADEGIMHTTLVQGAVKLVKGTREQLLKPGQQAQTTKGADKISLSDADIEMATAWMGNEFIFRQTDIKEVMRQITRWYDMDVEFRGEMTGITITGNVNRNVYVSSLLKALELTKTIKCKIEGRRIIVMPNVS